MTGHDAYVVISVDGRAILTEKDQNLLKVVYLT